VNATGRPAVEAGVTLYAHGGGFEYRNAEFEQVMAYRLSAATGRAAWAVDYRLAPAHPFPAALDDVVAAYQSLLDRGVPASRTVLFGESPGATLVLSALHVMRSQDMPRPGGIVAVSPITDLKTQQLLRWPSQWPQSPLLLEPREKHAVPPPEASATRPAERWRPPPRRGGLPRTARLALDGRPVARSCRQLYRSWPWRIGTDMHG
jgi:acetyl esterase/lipase